MVSLNWKCFTFYYRLIIIFYDLYLSNGVGLSFPLAVNNRGGVTADMIIDHGGSGYDDEDDSDDDEEGE